MHVNVVSTMLSLYQIGMTQETCNFKKDTGTHWHIKVTLLLSLLQLLPVQYAKSTKSCSLSLSSLWLPLSFPVKEGLIVAMSAVSRASRTKKLFTPLHILLSSFTLTSHSHFSHSDSPIMQTSHLFAPFSLSSHFLTFLLAFLAGEHTCRSRLK